MVNKIEIDKKMFMRSINKMTESMASVLVYGNEIYIDTKQKKPVYDFLRYITTINESVIECMGTMGEDRYVENLRDCIRRNLKKENFVFEDDADV